MSDISSKVIIKNNNTIVLTEDCKKDDYIDLSKVNKVDSAYINELINKEKDKEVKIKIDEAVDKQKQLAKLENESICLKFDSQKKDEISKLKEDYKRQINELNAKIVELETASKSLQDKLDAEKKLEISKIEDKYSKDINDLKFEITTIKSNKDLEIEKAKSEVKEQMQVKLDDVTSQLNKLQLNKSNLNVKQLGEQLETWCTREFETYKEAGAFTNCTWGKANDIVDGTKPDFYFNMYSSNEFIKENLVTSVCLEMKNESNVSSNKKKNSDHYAKLDQDRKKRNLQYAVLVSELEWSNENDIPVRKIPGYDDMYMVRPQYLISFLTLVYTLGLKYVSLINRIHKEDIKFEDSQKILNEFAELKRKYFEDPIESMIKKVSDMKKSVITIKDSANKLELACDDIINNTFIESQKKIEKFNITKIVKNISKLED